MPMIGIVDYGMGNLASVRNALESLGEHGEIVSDPVQAFSCDRLILPGVGSFVQAMCNLNQLGWTTVLGEYIATGRPLLGICLGMQLMFTRGEEHGHAAGLGFLAGHVTLLKPGQSLTVPHVGWNNLTRIHPHPLFKGVKPHVDFYFVHSYQCIVDEPRDVVAKCDYGGEFVASAGRDNVIGVQFHPEKSQPAGLRILENFAAWDGAC